MNMFETSANAMTTAGNTLTSTVAPNALSASMNSFLSPYRTQVIDDAVARLRDRRAIDMSAIGANASAAGAFGGSRHGLVESETMKNYGLEESELVSRLLQQGFDTAGGLGATSLGLQQSGAGGLASLGATGTNIGQSVSNQQMQAGTLQQQLLQALLSGAGQQYDMYSSQPAGQLGTILSAIQGNPLSGNVTQSYKPGLFDYLSLGANTYAAGK